VLCFADVSGANSLPCRVAILAHVNCAGHFVAFDLAFEGPHNGVTAYSHAAMQLELVRMDRALEGSLVNLPDMISGNVVAALLQRELLLSGASWIVDRDRPITLDLGGFSGWDNGIFVVARLRKRFVDSISDDLFVAGVHHVGHDGDAAVHHVWTSAT